MSTPTSSSTPDTPSDLAAEAAATQASDGPANPTADAAANPAADPAPLTPSDPGRSRELLSRLRQTLISNASVVGAVLVLGGLYLGQGLVADWLTDDETIDEDDIVAPTTDLGSLLQAESCDQWILTFSDEFDEDSINDENWIRYNSPAPDENGLRNSDATTVVDGNLVITGQMLEDELIIGGLASNHQQTYGRIEARVRTDLDPSETLDGVISTWPAGNEHPEGGNIAFYQAPAIGEREPFYSYIHHTNGTQDEVIHRANAQDWQEVAIEWNEDRVSVFRDDDLVGSTTTTDAIPDVPHVMTIQLRANKPAMDEAPDSVVQMYVDWVRFYRENENRGSDC